MRASPARRRRRGTRSREYTSTRVGVGGSWLLGLGCLKGFRCVAVVGGARRPQRTKLPATSLRSFSAKISLGVGPFYLPKNSPGGRRAPRTPYRVSGLYGARTSRRGRVALESRKLSSKNRAIGWVIISKTETGFRLHSSDSGHDACPLIRIFSTLSQRKIVEGRNV